MPIDQVNPGEAGDAEALTFDNTTGGVGFTASKIAVGPIRCTKAVFVLEGAECRFTVDGTTVSTTVGMLIEPGDVITIEGDNDISKFKCIRTGATSGTGFVTYFR